MTDRSLDEGRPRRLTHCAMVMTPAIVRHQCPLSGPLGGTRHNQDPELRIRGPLFGR